MPASWRMLPDGARLHLHHGPIDVILGADPPEARGGAFTRAVARFQGLLEELVAELSGLRSADPPPFTGPVAQAMARAVAPFRPEFVTPMAAVAGAVADALVAAMAAEPGLRRAYANDGGDVAFLLAPGEALTAAMPGGGRIALAAGMPWRGVATSGWRGRSHSLGIADWVTVLARTAAEADAAATLVANAVNLPGHPAVARRPARDLAPDSDLGDLPVTVAVGALDAAEIDAALDAGAARAQDYLARGLIGAAFLSLGGRTRSLGAPAAALPEPADA
ncbi:MAG: UPF0280 family protein [Rhodobacteraceae bacterium]|nr:UPF0280 family protein [Paracoccaceae bacterium]